MAKVPARMVRLVCVTASSLETRTVHGMGNARPAAISPATANEVTRRAKERVPKAAPEMAHRAPKIANPAVPILKASPG